MKMKTNPKYSAGLWVFSNPGDRFVRAGYKKPITTEEQLKLASKVKGIQGVELQYPSSFTIETDKIKALLKEYNLQVSRITLNTFSDPRWAKGAFTSSDEKLRREAIDRAKKTIDMVKELNAGGITMWLGSDGFDYPFAVDFSRQFDLMVAAITEIGEYDRTVKVSTEYKPREPRTHQLAGTAGQLLTIINEINMDNVGITMDVGHSIEAQEDPAEMIALMARYGKLFHTHQNDNFRLWDDDMVVGSVNIWETLEYLYWLDRVGYEGWYTLDMFPYREDPVQVAEVSIKNLKRMRALIEKFDEETLESAFKEMDALKSHEMIMDLLFGK